MKDYSTRFGNMFKVVALAAALGGAAGAEAATEIADGGTYTIGSTSASLVCRGDATLMVKPTETKTFPDGTQCYVTRAALVATNGTVTLDFSQCTDLPVLFTELFRADKNGKIVFKGAGKMFVGTDVMPKEPYPIAEKVQGKSFGLAAAESVDGFQGVEFVNIALLARPMPETGVSWTVRDGAVLGSLAARPFASAGYAGSDKAQLTGTAVTIANFDVWMMTTNVFESGATITVAANRTLQIKSMALNDTWGITSDGTDGWRHSQNIVLADATSRLMTRSGRGASLDGTISGPGYVESYDNYSCSTAFYGPVTFSGPIRLPYLYDKAVAGQAGYTFFANSVAWTEPKDILLNCGALIFRSGLSGDILVGTFTGHDFANSVVKMYNSAQNLQIGKLVGKFSLSSDVTHGTITVADAEAGAVIRVPSSSNVKIVAQVPVAKVNVLENGSTRATYYCFDGATVAAGDSLEILLLDVPEGLTLNLPNGADGVVLSGGKAKVRDCLGEGAAYVAENASLWLDASAAETVNAFTNSSGVQQYYNSKLLVYEWLDRSSRRQWLVGNYRGFGSFNDSVNPSLITPSGNGYASGATTVLPLYRENGLNNLPIFDFSGNNAKVTRAMIFKSKFVGPDQNDFQPAFCIMVYGSNGGGGSALLANKTGDFARSTNAGSLAVDGLDKPLIADNNNKGFEAWVNGEKVNVKNGNLLSGEWDIVSIDTRGVQVTGLGYAKNNTGDGMSSSQYAEVIFFHSVPTAEARASVELYLADKWGLMDKVTNHIVKARATAMVSGSGEVAVSGEVKLVGTLAGGLISVADGAKVTYENAAPSATKDDVAQIAGCVAWFDPSDPGMLVMSTGKDSSDRLKALEVSAISNRIVGAKAPLLVGNNPNSTSSRCPWLNQAKRAYRTGLNWMDYSIRYDGDTTGDYMYFANKVTWHSDTSREETAGRMAFIVSDSSRGGGTPVIDGTDPGGNGKIKVRSNPKYSDMIWKSGTGSEVTGGKTYLNGAEVDGTSTGFTGGPEVFAFSTTSDIDFCYQGYWSNSENKNYGEILGESLYFNRVLTDAERTTVTSYLMWKWLGTLPAGCNNFTEATLTGSGSISGVPQAALPQFGDDFSGTISFADATLDFGISTPDQPVAGVLVAPGATLAFDGEVTVNVTPANGRLKTGSYTLVDVAAFSGVTGWRLNFVGAADPNGRAKLVVEGGKVVLRIAKGGFIAIVK